MSWSFKTFRKKRNFEYHQVNGQFRKAVVNYTPFNISEFGNTEIKVYILVENSNTVCFFKVCCKLFSKTNGTSYSAVSDNGHLLLPKASSLLLSQSITVFLCINLVYFFHIQSFFWRFFIYRNRFVVCSWYLTTPNSYTSQNKRKS